MKWTKVVRKDKVTVWTVDGMDATIHTTREGTDYPYTLRVKGEYRGNYRSLEICKEDAIKHHGEVNIDEMAERKAREVYLTMHPYVDDKQHMATVMSEIKDWILAGDYNMSMTGLVQAWKEYTEVV